MPWKVSSGWISGNEKNAAAPGSTAAYRYYEISSERKTYSPPAPGLPGMRFFSLV
jgi:hypothetical protein